MDNLRGGLLMVLAMAGFALEDTFIKTLSADLPVGQILILIGIGGALIFSIATRLRGQRFITREVFRGSVMLRNLGEMIAAMAFLTALALTELSTTSAILQATPLAITLGAALFLREPVGWRRWSAILIGFVGVLMIIKPGFEGFQPASLFALIAVAALALRDLSTRVTPPSVTSLQLAGYAFASLIPAGVIMLTFSGGAAVLTPTHWAYLLLGLMFGTSGYYAIVAAMRIGDVSFVTSFRYTRLVFALILGALVFSERPDALTLAGAALIVSTGLYSIWRESRLRRAMPN